MMVYYYMNNNNYYRTWVKHSIIGIGNDIKHDSDAVFAFEKAAISIVSEKISITYIHEYTNGFAAQYKGCRAFADINTHSPIVTRNLFETSHGKSVCDGLVFLFTWLSSLG